MAQRRKGKGTHKNGKAAGGQHTAGDRADDPPLSDPPTSARPLTTTDAPARTRSAPGTLRCPAGHIPV